MKKNDTEAVKVSLGERFANEHPPETVDLQHQNGFEKASRYHVKL